MVLEGQVNGRSQHVSALAFGNQDFLGSGTLPTGSLAYVTSQVLRRNR